MRDGARPLSLGISMATFNPSRTMRDMDSNMDGRARRSRPLLRIAFAGGLAVSAACATPPAEERATAGSTARAEAISTPVAAAAVSADAAANADTATITVYKSPTCGCCADWVDHVEASGFKAEVRDMGDVGPVKTELGVPGHLTSCHTAVVGGYVVEGHVPADVIKRMLRERPQIAGIAVPGMPIGSPGMEGDGSRRDRYDIIAIGRDGRTSVYESR